MKESHAIGIVFLVLIVLIPVGYFAWKVQKRVEFDLTTREYVIEMYEARIVTLETQMEIFKKELTTRAMIGQTRISKEILCH